MSLTLEQVQNLIDTHGEEISTAVLDRIKKSEEEAKAIVNTIINQLSGEQYRERSLKEMQGGEKMSLADWFEGCANRLTVVDIIAQLTATLMNSDKGVTTAILNLSAQVQLHKETEQDVSELLINKGAEFSGVETIQEMYFQLGESEAISNLWRGYINKIGDRLSHRWKLQEAEAELKRLHVKEL